MKNLLISKFGEGVGYKLFCAIRHIIMAALVSLLWVVGHSTYLDYLVRDYENTLTAFSIAKYTLAILLGYLTIILAHDYLWKDLEGVNYEEKVTG